MELTEPFVQSGYLDDLLPPFGGEGCNAPDVRLDSFSHGLILHVSRLAAIVACWQRATSAFPHAKLFLELTARDRHAPGEEEVDEGHEQRHLHVHAAGDLQRRGLVGDDAPADLEEIEQADDEHQRGVLEQADGLTYDRDRKSTRLNS